MGLKSNLSVNKFHVVVSKTWIWECHPGQVSSPTNWFNLDAVLRTVWAICSLCVKPLNFYDAEQRGYLHAWQTEYWACFS